MIRDQLHSKTVALHILDTKYHLTYSEGEEDSWTKHAYDCDGNEIYFETSSGFWAKYEYDDDGYQKRYEDSLGMIKHLPIV